MGRYESVAFLITLFLVTNMLGLVAAAELQQHEEIQETADQHDSAEFGIYFFILIGISTALLLLLYRYKLNFAIKGWLMLALGLTTLIFFSALFAPLPALGLSAAVMLGWVYTGNMMIRNVLMMFPLAGAGAFFGSMFGFEAVLVLLVILSLYDYFSVNISEHMIDLAKSGVETNTFMGFTYPKEGGGIPLDDTAEAAADDVDTVDDTDGDDDGKDSDVEEPRTDAMDAAEPGEDAVTPEAEGAMDGTGDDHPEAGTGQDVEEPQRGGVGLLGGGDIVIPLIFAATLLQDFGFIIATVSVVGAATGLGFLLVKAQHGKFYPAIPPVAIGSVAGFGLGWILIELVPTLL